MDDKKSGTVLFVTILLAVLSIIFGTFTISCLWGWYLVPLGVKGLTFAHAFGISIFINYFVNRPKSVKFVEGIVEKPTIRELLARTFGFQMIALFLGWLGSLFM